jgi:hypothetical protein
MKFLKLITLFTVAAISSGCVINVEKKTADVHLEQDLNLSTTGIRQLSADVGAGSLSIVGSATATEITVSASIHTTEDREFELSLEKHGQIAELYAHHGPTVGFWVGSSPSIDLVVTVPSSLMLDIEDGSGDISIEQVDNAIFIDDGSGAIEVSDITGNITIEDNSGDLMVENVQGNIVVDDNSGSILIQNIDGQVDIEDGSGELIVKNVTGKAVIDDGSGDILVINTGGLTVIESGSGGLKISEIKGEVDIDS